MSLTLLLYLCDLFTKISDASSIIMDIWVTIFLVGGIASSFEEEIDKFLGYARKSLWILICTAIIYVFIPNKNTMYLMLGTSYLQTSNLPEKVSQALELKLDSVIEDFKNKDNQCTQTT